MSDKSLQIDSLGASSITVTNPIRMDYKASLSPVLQKLNMVTNAGIENLRFTRDVAGTATTRNNQFTVFYNYAANCWIRGCRVYQWLRGGCGHPVFNALIGQRLLFPPLV